jgi:hypothetical protein
LPLHRVIRGCRGSRMLEVASGRLPGVPFSHFAVGGRASRFLAAPSTCSTQEERQSALQVLKVSTRLQGRWIESRLTATQIKIIWILLSICGTPMMTFNTMGISSEKLGQANRQSEDKMVIYILTCQQEAGTRSFSSDYHTPGGLQARSVWGVRLQIQKAARNGNGVTHHTPARRR